MSTSWVCFKKEKKNHYYQLQKCFNLITSIIMRQFLVYKITIILLLYNNIGIGITNNNNTIIIINILNVNI